MSVVDVAAPVPYAFEANPDSIKEHIFEMSFMDGNILANKKNKVKMSQLHTELRRISKEEENDLKMYKNEIQKFKKKYNRNERRASDVSYMNLK